MIKIEFNEDGKIVFIGGSCKAKDFKEKRYWRKSMTQIIATLDDVENKFVEEWKLKNSFGYKGEAVVDIIKKFKKLQKE